MKKIMVNVDDLGLSPAVNQAVVQLAQTGRIQASSFMSLGHIRHDEVAELTQSGIDIGLHFDLTGLAHQGCLKTVLLRSLTHTWSKRRLYRLLTEQLDKFEDKIGHAPVFIDGHQHVHQFAQIRTVLLETVLHRYGHQVAIRSTRTIQSDFKARLIYQLGGRRLTTDLRHLGIVHNPAFAGVYGFDADAQGLAQLWQSWLSGAPADGLVIMCHPAVPNNSWQDEIKPAREREWAWLSSNTFRQLWQKHQCTPQYWHNWLIPSHPE